MKSKALIYIFFLFATSATFSNEATPLDTLLKRSMSAAEKYNELVENFEAEVYMRTYVETLKKNFLYKYTHLVPRFVLHDPHSDEALIETLSTLKFDYPNNYVQDIKYVTGTLTSKKDIEMVPFYLLNINVYGETTNDESFFMPVRFSTAKYYTYKLRQTHTENENTYYTIDFDPIYENSKLLKGSFVVENGTWRIIHFKAEGIDIFADFSFEITMGNEWITNYLPVEFVIYHNAAYLGNVVASRHLATIQYKEIELRQVAEKRKYLNISDFYRIRVDLMPIVTDSVFWDENRAIPLQAREKEVMTQFYAKQQEKIKTDKKDSVQDKSNAQQIAQSIVSNTRYKYKSTLIDYSGLFNPLMVGYSSQDGISYRQKVYFNLDLKRSRTFKVNAFAGYMFKRKELFTDVTTTWNYEPFFLGSVSFSAGIGNPLYSSLNLIQNQDSLPNGGIAFEDISFNRFTDYYVKLFNNYEIFNGFLATAGVDYHIRRPSKYSVQELEANGNGNAAIYETRKAFVPFIRLSWTPEQYYRYEGRQKIYVRSRFPTFKVEFSRSFSDILGSNSQYNRVEFDINQNIPLGLMNSFQYHIGAGKFINQKTQYFADFYYFSKNFFPENWRDGIGGGFNLLRRHLYNASDSYVQAHFMFETPFLVLKTIPFVSEFADKERLYLSQLYTPQIVSYTEIGYGIGNRFFNAAVFGSFHKTKFREIGARASFEF